MQLPRPAVRGGARDPGARLVLARPAADGGKMGALILTQAERDLADASRGGMFALLRACMCALAPCMRPRPPAIA